MLLDTSGLLCLLNEADPKHIEAIAQYQSATTRVTHSLVIAELVTLATSRRLNRPKVLAYISDILSNPAIKHVWVDEMIFKGGIQLLAARQDKTYSLCDAVSFLVMRDRGIFDALTLDHHFEQEGFRRLLV
jgi:predicted nucleic acid-binding protein